MYLMVLKLENICSGVCSNGFEILQTLVRKRCALIGLFQSVVCYDLMNPLSRGSLHFKKKWFVRCMRVTHII